MTSQNQQPQELSPIDQPPGHPNTNNSSWTTTQPINTNSIPQQQTPLPEQKGPDMGPAITSYARGRVPTSYIDRTINFCTSITNS